MKATVSVKKFIVNEFINKKAGYTPAFINSDR